MFSGLGSIHIPSKLYGATKRCLVIYRPMRLALPDKTQRILVTVVRGKALDAFPIDTLMSVLIGEVELRNCTLNVTL